MIPGNLIINADDFGLDARVSEAIAMCLDEGLINSFSVYPFRDKAHAALLESILARHPGVRVGAHLAVVDGALREHPGHFRDFLARYLTGRMPPSRVMALWKSQIETLGGLLGGTARIAHLDSHQHLHVLPGLWAAARALQREYRIPRLRVPYESLGRSLAYRFPFGLGLQGLACLRRDGKARRFLGFLTSTRFTVAGNRRGLEQVIARPDLRFELMVHPALPPEIPAGPGASAPGAASTAVGSREKEISELRLLPGFFRSLMPAGKDAPSGAGP
ncbi:MAG TPA: ChbG/HpnK family deacetylase [Fibrobacteria bacterium]|nr:ChbG/HpnK family deacetylase [Fibrobacteria bacterium]